MAIVYVRDQNGQLMPVETVQYLKGEGLSTEITEFNQMNDAVVAYLAAADAAYTDDNGGDSIIYTEDNTGGTIQPDYQDKPLGLTVASQAGTFYLQNEESAEGWKASVPADSYTIYNVVPGSVSQYLIKDAEGNLLENGRIKPTGKVRMLRFEWDARNSRDLGGWDCDGGTVKYGKLFRGAVVNNTDYQAQNALIAKAIGIRRQIDFRSDEEAGYQTDSRFGESVRYDRITLNNYYQDIIDTTGADYANAKKVFRTIVDAVLHNEPLYFNCSLGRDRTGTIAFMILSLLGVARRNIEKEYELSSFSSLTEYEDKTIPALRTSLGGLVTYLSTFGGATLRDNAVWWFIKAGFSLADLNAFRSAMTNGTPETLTAEDFVQTYSIKKYLTGYEISNADTSAEDGTRYTATLSFADGYNSESSVSVIMGGTDVTADVYADGVITIPAVTGDVVITAVAVYVPTYTNQIPISTDYDGSIYNGVGYKSDMRINGSGEVVEQESIYTTGFIPCKTGDRIYFKNMDLDTNSSVIDQVRLAFYDSSKTIIWAHYWSVVAESDEAEISADGMLQSIVVPVYDTEVAFARFSSYSIYDKSVITVNEEIK